MAIRDYMDKNLEVLVAAHQIARDRARAGKPSWDRHIDIESILTRDGGNVSVEHCVTVGTEIAALLRQKLPPAFFDMTSKEYDRDINELVLRLDGVSVADYDGGHDNPADDLNNRISELYDWADIHRVWLSSSGRSTTVEVGMPQNAVEFEAEAPSGPSP